MADLQENETLLDLISNLKGPKDKKGVAKLIQHSNKLKSDI